MKKELLIIVYKINVGGFSSVQAQEVIHRYVENCSLRNDEELKENYMIREIFMPINNGDSDVQVIYPISPSSSEIHDLIKEINEKMYSEPISDDFKKSWKNLLRELKIRNLENNIIY